MTNAWTGSVNKGTEPNTVIVTISDNWGWEITLHGTLAPGGGYPLTGTLGAPPAALRIPAIDGEEPRNA